MRCPQCGHENAVETKFCGECGTRLAVLCRECAARNAPTQKFCGECGARLESGASSRQLPSPDAYTPKHLAEKILTSKTALEGERKQVTVLFADLKGSMELLAGRDPEEAREILDAVLERMMEAVHRYEGTVNQVMGDGIMALFGAPLAHEDHAVRACSAALRMQDAVRRYADDLRRTQGLPVHMRVGLNSGEVVVRTIGSDLRMDYTAVGQTTHLAARMEQMAMPGVSLMTSDTLRLAEGYVQVHALGRVSVKGLADPVETYELIGTGLAHTRMQVVAARGFTRFIGRDREMRSLRGAGELMNQHHGQVVAVVGEPGVGKSRLFWEFTQSQSGHGSLILESASVSHRKTTAYLPLTNLLRGYFRIASEDDTRRATEKITDKVQMLDRALEPHLPALLALVDVPVEDPTWVRLEPHQRRRRTLEAARRLLLRESQNQPLVLAFEDLHWLDTETQTFLDSLVESIPTARVLLLVNYRPEYEHGWSQKTYYSELRLDPLPPESAAELLDALLGTDANLEPLKSLLTKRTEGNPFFLEECVRTLDETGYLDGDRGSYRQTRSVGEVQIPMTVQAVLAARIDRLPPDEKRLLQAAAAIGKDVPFPLLEVISDLSKEALLQRLGQLQATELVYEARLFPELGYTFKHALTHTVAYQSLLKSTRQQLHGRIASAMLERFPAIAGAQPELLAHHLTECGRLGEAVVEWERAGERAVGRSAFTEGIAHFRRGLDILKNLSASAERSRRQVSILLKLGGPLAATRGHNAPEVLELYSRTRALCEEIGETRAHFDVLEGLWMYHHVSADLVTARDLGEQLLAIAAHTNDGTHLLCAHKALGLTIHNLGDFPAAREHLERALAHHDPERHINLVSAQGGDPGIVALTYLTTMLLELGYPHQGFAAAQRAFALGRSKPQSFNMAWALLALWRAHFRRGAITESLEIADSLIALSKEQGFSTWLNYGRIFRATSTSCDAPAKAIPLLRDALAVLPRWAQVNRLLWTLPLVSACLRAEQIATGLAIVDELFAHLERTGDRACEAQLCLVHGQLLLACAKDDENDAELSFQKALAVSRRQHIKLTELATATALAQLWRRRGKRDAARGLLKPIYAWFTEGLEYPELRKARLLLDDLSKR